MRFDAVECPVCRATITKKVHWVPLIRELRMHVLFAHQEELRARLDNPDDPIIAELADDYEIVVNRKDLS